MAAREMKVYSHTAKYRTPEITWDRLKQIRESWGLTELAMSLLLGVSISTLKTWGQTGRIRTETAAHIEALAMLGEKGRRELLKKRGFELTARRTKAGKRKSKKIPA